MYISVFRWGSRSLRNYFSNVRTIAVASDSRKKTMCNAINRGIVRISNKKFSRCFAWSRRRKFSYLRNFDRSWSSRRCFWRRLRAIWAISGSRHWPRSRRLSITCNRVNINKPKLRNFDRPLGFPGHLQWRFDVDNVSSLRNTMVWMRGNCHCHQPWNNSRDRADVNRRKSGRVHTLFAEFRWTIRIVLSSPAMFLTSATCHLFEKRRGVVACKRTIGGS